MAINPIDLQTLFTQMDKIGKEQVQQTQVASVKNAIQQDISAKKNLEKKTSVEETKAINSGVVGVKDGKSSNGREESKKKRSPYQQDKDEEDFTEVIRDPNLGRRIDISE
ncbi:MAG: hypothetical protein IIW10_04820 [Spirochaetaceae bacterium]|nr:hypothetical protein [Spirochaetaceae bacterium]